MTKSSCDISVVIPAFNEEKYLGLCLRAVKNQHYRGKYEIIVVNNNSTDATENIAKSFEVRVVQEKRRGVVYAKQTGCMLARGRIIVVLDADNVPPPHWLQTIETLLRDASLAAVTGPYLMPDHTPWWGKLQNSILYYITMTIQFLTHDSWRIWGGNIAFRKADFLKFGGYDVDSGFTADEIKLSRDLHRFGRIRQYDELAVHTSTRRYSYGAYYYFIEWGFKGYVLNSILATFFRRTVAEPKPIRIRE